MLTQPYEVMEVYNSGYSCFYIVVLLNYSQSRVKLGKKHAAFVWRNVNS
jgi:hypothetical protein